MSEKFGFECPACNGVLAADTTAVGCLTTCPLCGEEVVIPEITERDLIFTDEVPQSVVRCPLCGAGGWSGGALRAGSRLRCSSCGERFNYTPDMSVVPCLVEPTGPAPAPAPAASGRSRKLWLAVGLGLGGVLLLALGLALFLFLGRTAEPAAPSQPAPRAAETVDESSEPAQYAAICAERARGGVSLDAFAGFTFGVTVTGETWGVSSIARDEVSHLFQGRARGVRRRLSRAGPLGDSVVVYVSGRSHSAFRMESSLRLEPAAVPSNGTPVAVRAVLDELTRLYGVAPHRLHPFSRLRWTEGDSSRSEYLFVLGRDDIRVVVSGDRLRIVAQNGSAVRKALDEFSMQRKVGREVGFEALMRPVERPASLADVTFKPDTPNGFLGFAFGAPMTPPAGAGGKASAQEAWDVEGKLSFRAMSRYRVFVTPRTRLVYALRVQMRESACGLEYSIEEEVDNIRTLLERYAKCRPVCERTSHGETWRFVRGDVTIQLVHAYGVIAVEARNEVLAQRAQTEHRK